MHEGSLMTLSDEIRKCTKCIDLGIARSDRLSPHQKPYVNFGVERKWKPDEVRVLFIAESPPWNGKQRYFYNPSVGDESPGLRERVLKYLKLNSPQEFLERNACMQRIPLDDSLVQFFYLFLIDFSFT